MRPARLLRAPLLHFLVLGALLHGVMALRPATIEFGAADLAEFDAQWWRETGRAPTPPEQAAMRQRAADEEMLVREAIRLELDASDPVVRARLLRNIALIASTDSTADEDEALAHARRLDMAARDVLARRRLLQLMEARLSASTAPLDPAEIDAHVAAHPQRYAIAARSSFVHAFFGHDARRVDDALRAGAPDPARAGDAFPAGTTFDSVSEARVAGLFGSAFAATVASAPIGQWVRASSPYGLHLVRVSARASPGAGTALRAGSAAIWGAIEERERARLREGIERLRAHYRVVIGDRA